MSNATDGPRKENANMNDFNHAAPIPILASRRSSTASSASDGSPTTPPDIQTSTSYPSNIAPSSPTGSVFPYFMGTSPKSSASFPYRRLTGFGAPPVFEDDDGQEIEARSTLHKRRSTTSWCNSRVPTQSANPAPVIEAQQARGAGVLRRLSLGGGFAPFLQTNTNRPPSPPEPPTPPPSAVTPTVNSGFAANQTTPRPMSRVRRSATLNIPSSNARRRAPSPMGERILKGHFDGFN